jgi:hypothetical protein
MVKINSIFCERFKLSYINRIFQLGEYLLEKKDSVTIQIVFEDIVTNTEDHKITLDFNIKENELNNDIENKINETIENHFLSLISKEVKWECIKPAN